MRSSSATSRAWPAGTPRSLDHPAVTVPSILHGPALRRPHRLRAGRAQPQLLAGAGREVGSVGLRVPDTEVMVVAPDEQDQRALRDRLAQRAPDPRAAEPASAQMNG